MKKKTNSKKLLIIAGIFLIVGFIYVISNGKNAENDSEQVYYEVKDGKYINNSEELNSDKSFEGLKLDNIEFFYDTTVNETNISFDAINKSNKPFKEAIVLLSFINKKGEVLSTMFASIPNLEEDQSKTVYGTISGNTVDAYDVMIQAWD